MKRFEKRNALVLLLIITLLMSILSGCSGNTSGSDEKIIRFGAALPLTGGVSTEGEKHKHGYDLWMETVNANGGIEINGEKHKVEIKYYDYQSDSATAVKLVEKAITEDNIKLIFGPFGSGVAKAVSAVTERYNVPMIAPSASSEEVFSEGYKYIFGTFTPNYTLTEPLAEIAANQNDAPKTVAIIARNDLFPLSIGNEAKTSVEKRGMEVVAFEQYAIGTSDFAPTLIQIKALNPDWVFATGYANDLIQITRQMKELGINSKMVTMIAGAVYKEYVEGLGADANNVITACWWANNVDYQGTDVFGTAENYTKMFSDKYGYIPDYVCASASAVGVIFQEAIERANSTDPVKVRDELSAIDFTTFWGPIRFDERGMITSLDPPVLQIQNQELQVLFPGQIKQSELVYPKPGF